MSIQFEKTNSPNGVSIPSAAMKVSGFVPGEDVRYHTLKGAVVILKKRMNAAELIRAAWALQQLSAELCAHLAAQCFPCDGCAECGGDGERCIAYDPADFAADVDLPDELREKAGIPKDMPLHVELENGKIVVSANRDGPGLWDVPAPMMQGFLAAGICPAGLEELLKTGEIVYGG